MTNWMTAAGIAFLAGGLATLISLRSVLFGGGKRRRARKAEAAPPPARQVEAASPPARRVEAPPSPARRVEAASPPARRVETAPPPARRVGAASPPARRVEAAPPAQRAAAEPSAQRIAAEPSAQRIAAASSAWRLAAASSVRRDKAGRRAEKRPSDRRALEPARPVETQAPAPRHVVDLSETTFLVPAPAEDADSGGLAAIGLRAEDDGDFIAEDEPASVDFPAPPEDEAARSVPVRRVDRSDRRYGDRVAGWIRPEYQDDPPQSPSGEYWTPVPIDDLAFDLAADDPEPSAKGYGWPTQVERLPAVPDYEPATGFDLVPIRDEPTEAVPIWPADRRVRLPPSWTGRNDKPAGNRFLENEPGPGRRTNYDEADQRFRPPAGEPVRRRPRPRPRPAPAPDDAYVSRHAAEPPR